MHVWGMTTIASVGHYLKKKMEEVVAKSCPDKSFLVPFMVHDFGMRGVFTGMNAGMAGMAYLSSGMLGTDNMEGVRYINHYYNTDKIYGSSVWATEHSVATSFGLELEDEIQYVLHQLNNAPIDAIVSIVMDSKNTYRFAEKVMSDPRVMAKVKEKAVAGGRTVLRPDSGIPEEVVNRVLVILGHVYGVYYNDYSYKVIKHSVGVLQGDGMDINSIPALFGSIMANGWSAENLVTGSGGGLLQKWNRDDLRFAIKASSGEVAYENGVKRIDIQKDPETANTGNETKKSKRGILKVVPSYNKEKPFMTVSSSDTDPIAFNAYVDAMVTIFENGVVSEETLDFQAIIDRG